MPINSKLGLGAIVEVRVKCLRPVEKACAVLGIDPAAFKDNKVSIGGCVVIAREPALDPDKAFVRLRSPAFKDSELLAPMGAVKLTTPGPEADLFKEGKASIDGRRERKAKARQEIAELQELKKARRMPVLPTEVEQDAAWRELPETFTQLRFLHAGSFGSVCSALDEKQEAVAIKNLPSPWQDLTTARAVFRQVKLMGAIKHEHIVALHDLIMTPSKHVFLVMEFIPMTLGHFLNPGSGFQLGPDAVMRITYQTLSALKYLHSLQITHRDIRPESIGIISSGAIVNAKLLDLGKARFQDSEPSRQYSMAAPSGPYSSPEIYFGMACDRKTDIWSLGCVFIELLLGRRSFHLSQSPFQVVKGWYDLLGPMPPACEEMVTTALSVLSMDPSYVPLSAPSPDAIRADTQTSGLLLRMLSYRVADRLSAEECLAHPYFTPLQSPQIQSLVAAMRELSDAYPPTHWAELVEAEVHARESMRRGYAAIIPSTVMYPRVTTNIPDDFPSTEMLSGPEDENFYSDDAAVYLPVENLPGGTLQADSLLNPSGMPTMLGFDLPPAS
eukprot:m.23469 g.23469  ORF g.23469 m.23469 type:complete len:557 (+) comp3907_c0_seq1:109-1779(+)